MRRGNCYPSTRGIPAAHRTFRGLMFRKTSGQLLREHTFLPLGSPSAHVQGPERCSCDRTAALARHKHTWISLRVQRNKFRQKDCCVLTPRAHLDLFPCANRHVHATTLLHPHAVSTLGFLSVRKQTCSGEKLLHFHAGSTVGSLSVPKETCSIEKIAAFSRREHTWISLRAQGGMFQRKDSCVRTPRAHLCVSFPPCSRRHVPAKRLLPSHAASTLGSVPSKRLLRSRAAPQDRWFLLADARSSFYSQMRTRPLRYREP